MVSLTMAKRIMFFYLDVLLRICRIVEFCFALIILPAYNTSIRWMVLNLKMSKINYLWSKFKKNSGDPHHSLKLHKDFHRFSLVFLNACSCMTIIDIDVCLGNKRWSSLKREHFIKMNLSKMDIHRFSHW